MSQFGISFTKTMDALRSAVWVLNEQFKEMYEPGTTTDFYNREQRHRSNLVLFDATHAQSATTGLQAYRAAILSAIRAQGRAMIDPILSQLGRAMGVPERSPGGVLNRLRKYMLDENLTIASDFAVFGIPSEVVAPSRANFVGNPSPGNPRVYRLTVDKDGYPLEAGCFTEEKKFLVTSDQSGGVNPGSEVWGYYGKDTGLDLIESDGSGVVGSIQTDSANNGSSLLQNSSFGDLDGTAAAPDSIPGWTVGTAIANFQLTTTTQRKADTEDTAYALFFESTDSVSQAFSVNGITVDDPDGTPWMLHGWARIAAGTGTFTWELGTNSASMVFGSQTGYYPFYLPIDENLYPVNWMEDNPTVTLSFDGTGDLYVDDLYCGPMRRVGANGRHTFVSIIAGSIDLLRGDNITLEDERFRQGIIARWLLDLYGVSLPNVDTLNHNISEPTEGNT